MTSVMADRFPPDLHLFRNYHSPLDDLLPPAKRYTDEHPAPPKPNGELYSCLMHVCELSELTAGELRIHNKHLACLVKLHCFGLHFLVYYGNVTDSVRV